MKKVIVVFLSAFFAAVALSLFSVEIRWYGLMYLAAFLTVYLLVLFRLKTERFDFTK
ncbi:MAG: prolipoprotein diacylglyceryl transferase, partial [Candidatus Omnitrophica bacterium]|nr:prolipoprotein diacylglyceryl transferase [Candidatus Omnitrophota bacterium]